MGGGGREFGGGVVKERWWGRGGRQDCITREDGKRLLSLVGKSERERGGIWATHTHTHTTIHDLLQGASEKFCFFLILLRPNPKRDIAANVFICARNTSV